MKMQNGKSCEHDSVWACETLKRKKLLMRSVKYCKTEVLRSSQHM